MKRLLALMLTLVALCPAGALAQTAGDGALYAKYAPMFADAAQARYGPIYPGEDGVETSNKAGRYLQYDDAIVVQYMDEAGSVERYQMIAYGEGTCWRYDYYLLEGGVVGITELTEGYVIHTGFENPEHMFYDFGRYIQDGEAWYQLDDVGKLAYAIDDVYLSPLADIERAFESGLPLAEPFEDGVLLNEQ